MEPIQLPKKRFVFEFLGGFMDGERLDSRSDNPAQAHAARGRYLMSHGGKVGTRYRSYSDAGREELMTIGMIETPDGLQGSRIPQCDMNHVYELTDRDEDDELIVLQYRFKGLSNPDGSMNF